MKKTTAKKATKKVEITEPSDVTVVGNEVTVTPKKSKWEPSIGEACWWEKGDEKFIGEIRSFDPLVVAKHDVYDNVHRDNVIDVNPKDYKITPMSKEEIYRELH